MLIVKTGKNNKHKNRINKGCKFKSKYNKYVYRKRYSYIRNIRKI